MVITNNSWYKNNNCKYVIEDDDGYPMGYISTRYVFIPAPELYEYSLSELEAIVSFMRTL